MPQVFTGKVVIPGDQLDAYLDTLPPAAERAGDRHYTRDPVSHHFSETVHAHEHAAHH